ncbi:MAG: DUF3391 domain-containing protein [Burkholderiaceae bacterium]
MASAAPARKDHFIAPSRLCIGLYVHLDLPWTDHPFTFSSFRIKGLDQIADIQALGLERIRYSPDKSEADPLPETAPAPAPAATGDREETAALKAKRERLQRVAAHHARVASCERQLMSNAKAVKAITQNMFARPAEAGQDAARLADALAASMLVDADVAVHLVADKIGNEDVYHHSLNVALMSMLLAKELKAPAEAVRLIGLGALLHDVGKADIPDRVLHKNSPLTKPELALLQQHCAAGVAIGRKMGLPPEALTIIEQHHEQTDGSGYPAGLDGAQMNLLARIVSLVNAYDNLCNPTNPALALTPHVALSTLFGQRRGQFDATAMATFVRILGVYPPGTVVTLSNGTIAMVVSVNASRPLKPTVVVYDPAVPRREAMVVDLEEEPDVTITKTLRPQQLPPAVHDYLSPRRRMTYGVDSEAGPRA